VSKTTRSGPPSYLTAYNLAADAFGAELGHRCCFPHRSYMRAKAYLQYATKRWEGFILVTGGPGAGKTTLLEDFLSRLEERPVIAARLSARHLESGDLLRSVATAFGLGVTQMDTAGVLQSLERSFIERLRQGRRLLLVVDDAHALSWRGLVSLGLLAGLRLGERPLVQLFLVGRDELREVMRSHRMEQFHGRLIAASVLEPLSEPETRAYAECRLRCAGWVDDPEISAEVFELIHQLSRGVPQQINLVAGQLLADGAAKGRHRLEGKDVKAAAAKLRRSHRFAKGDEANRSLVPPCSREGRATAEHANAEVAPVTSLGATLVRPNVSPPAQAVTGDTTPKALRGKDRHHPFLVVMNGRLEGVVHPLRPGRTVVGRIADCAVVLNDPGASRRHAELDCKPQGQLLLRDLGTTNGTWVNGRRVRVCELTDGDRIQFGSQTVYTVRIRGGGKAKPDEDAL
jgi:general secretion pathway protein A